MSDLPPAVAMIARTLVAITCPVERAIVAACLARHLPRIRREALQEARGIHKVTDIASLARVTPGRIYQLTSRPLAGQETLS